MRNYLIAKSPWARRAAVLSLGAFTLSIVALSSAAEPTTNPASTTAAPAAGQDATASASDADTIPGIQTASTSVPLSKQTFTVVQATGIKIPAHSEIDVHKPVTLKKGQLLVLKSSSGETIEVMGPYQGKPLDHYTSLTNGGTMGFDMSGFNPPSHCAPHPSGGPNPDETGGAEAHATHC